MELIDKARILVDVLDVFGEDENWKPMFEYSDLGFPFAYGIANGYILGLTEKGEGFIEEAWDFFCEIVGVDPDAEWEDLDELIRNSNNFVEA